MLQLMNAVESHLNKQTECLKTQFEIHYVKSTSQNIINNITSFSASECLSIVDSVAGASYEMKDFASKMRNHIQINRFSLGNQMSFIELQYSSIKSLNNLF